MNRKMIQVTEDVYDALFDLKYDYRERSLSDTILHLFHDAGIEPFDEDDDYD